MKREKKQKEFANREKKEFAKSQRAVKEFAESNSRNGNREEEFAIDEGIREKDIRVGEKSQRNS